MSSERIINRDNYEEFFLDWLDGNLDGSLLPFFLQFLEENPDLAAELRGMEQMTLTPGKVPGMPGKASLKKKILPVKDINPGNYEQKIVASMEGQLSLADQKHLDEFLSLNPALQYDAELYRKTKIEADPGIVFPNKERLKRRPVLYFSGYRLLAVISAAAILLFILIWRAFIPPPQGTIILPEVSAVQPQATESNARTSASPFDEKQTEEPSRSNIYTEDPSEEIAVIAERTQPITVQAIEINGIVTRKKAPVIRHSNLVYDHTQYLASGDQPKKSSLLGKVLRNFGAKAAERADMIREVAKDRNPASSMDFWDLADMGVKSFNKLADRDVALSVVKDETGTPMKYSLKEDNRVLLSRPINQP